MATVETALYLASLGFSVIPVENRGKHPKVSWAEFQKRRASESEIRAWWNVMPDSNIGVVTGEVSDLFVVDLDGQEAIQSAQTLRLPLTWVCKTGKGWHYYYRYPGPIAKNSVRTWPGIDVRTDGGYVVAPGSIHSTGAVYAFDESYLPDHGPRQNISLELVERLARPQISKPVLFQGEGRFSTVSLGGRNDTASRLAGYLIYKKIPLPEIQQILQLWNRANPEPLPENELDATVESIWKREPLGETSEPDFHPVPLGDLLSQTPVDYAYLWKPYIESNGISLLVSLPKVGKSLLSAHLARSVVNGTPFLGEPVKKGNVLMIELEESHQRLAARCRSLGLEKNVYVHLGSLKTTEELYRRLENHIIENGITLVIINTLARFLSVENENDARQIAQAVAPLLDLRRKVPCAFLVVHHANKIDNETPRGIRGSTDLFASVDTAMMLRCETPESPREMLAWSRDAEVPYKITMELLEGNLVKIPNQESKKRFSI